MKRKAVFFDRDNTLIANDGYLGDPDKVQLIEGAADAIARLRAMGFLTVVFSNQSGVARGLFDEEAVQAVNSRMDTMLRTANSNAILDRHEYCPFHPEATVEKYRQDSELRKPKAGMIHRAHHALDLNLGSSWVIGDAPRDMEAGRTAGCKTILVQNPSLPPSPASESKSAIRPDYTCTNLKEAVDFIEQSLRAASNPRPITARPKDEDKSSGNGAAEPEEPEPPPQRAVAETPPVPNTPDPSPRLESLATQILLELKRRNEREHTDFAISKLLAGIVQVIVIALLFVAYLNNDKPTTLHSFLLLAITFQTMAVALLLMRR